ncbi:MAG: beta strand repeat-containing protein, partial [Limisphaerales bacterium]
MKKLSLAALLTAVLAIVPNAAHAQRSYWDPGGATVANTSSATWENALWQTVASGSSPAPSGTGLTTFTETGLCGFICTNGTGAVLGTYTVTMNANHTVAGIFNGNLTDAVSTNLQIVSGNGSKLSVVSGDQGFSTQANGNSTLNVGLTGVGNPQFQGSGSWFLWGNNSTLTGNIELTSTSVNFNNNNSFGGGFITNTATTSILATPAADGGGTANGASSPLTIANNMWLRNAASKIIFVQGSASAPVTWTGLWQCNGTSGSTITLDWRAVSSSIQSSNTIQGVISGTGINYLITNANVGTSKVVFTGANTYTGTTTIGAPSTGATGTTNAYLQIGANGTTGNLGTGAVTANNLLIFNRSDTPTVANAISGTGAVILTNATGGATFTGALSYTGGTFINSGVTLTVSGAGTMAANPITNNGTLAFNSTGNSPLSQVISGTGSITKAGSGTLTLSGLNNFTGKTAINGGLVTINAAGGAENALGTPPTGSPVADQLSFNGGAISLGSAANVTLDANRGITLNAGGGTVQGASKDLTIPGPIVGVGSLTKTGSANLLVSGNCSYNGCIITGGGFRANSDSACGTNAITIGPSSSVITFRNISPAVTTTITNNITVNGGGTSDIDVTCAVGNTFTLSGNISGGGQFLRGRAVGAQGTVVLNGNNSSWSGGLILVRGGLQLGNKNALGSGTLVVSNSATSPEAHVIQTSANLTGANAVANNVNVLNNGWIIGGANNIEFSGTVTLSSAAAAITNNNSASTILSGNITGAQPLSFQGTGTTKVTGTTTYTGATTVGGTLQVDGNITASSGVTVASGGTLKGNGVVPGTTVSGAVNPGASPGTLSVTNTLTFNAGSTNIVEINDPTGTAGANWDLINCNALAINGAMKLKVNSLTALNASGAAANFNNGNDYSLLILHATNGISAGDTTLITVDSNDFAANNTMGNGLFQVAAVTNIDLTVDLVLQFRRIAAITAQPAPTTACIGSTANISITATGSSVSYQWSKGGVNLANGQPVSGSSATVATNVTTSTLVLTGVDVNAADTYACRVQATVGSAVNSSSATLSVPTPPTIATPVADSSSTVDAGANVPLSVTLSGGTFISYQWQKGGVNLSNGAHDNAATVSGSQSANLNLTSVRAADSGVYTCIVSAAGGCGTVTSFSTTLSVNDPVITQQPANSTIQCGSSNALTVTAIGTTNANGVLTYQWYTPDASGTAITDATNSILSFPTASFANAGSYSLVVSNALGNSITSSVVVVTIQDTNGPVISVNVGTDTVECHTSFIDAGATANDACDGSVIVTTTGSVDTNSVNFYTLTYSASDSHGNSSTATRVVTVHDTTAPTLSLLGSPVTTISCGTPYSDAGATASDTCAGDLTSQIAVNYGGLVPGAPVAGDYTITYNVSDQSLNPATPVTRVVHVIDTVPPVVTLIGNAVVTNECHTAFADPGATANDACAGNVTGSIVITGNL